MCDLGVSVVSLPLPPKCASRHLKAQAGDPEPVAFSVAPLPPADYPEAMKVTQLHAFLVRIPQKPPVAPYQSRYRASSEKEAVLIRLETDTGLVGWGETPVDWIHKSFEGAPQELLRRQVLGRDPFDLEAWYAENTLGSYLASGVEMAFWDLIGKATGQPLYKLLGGAVRKRIELAACMGIRPYEEAKAIARGYLEQGFTTLKTKAGRRAAEDLEMVRGIRDGVG